MRLITPVHLFETRAAVSNLHKGLLFLIMDQPGISDNDRRREPGDPCYRIKSLAEKHERVARESDLTLSVSVFA